MKNASASSAALRDENSSRTSRTSREVKTTTYIWDDWNTNGEIVAHYDYSPFGEPLVASGPIAATFTHQFSTKPWCAYTGLVEYQKRNYRPDIGRWMSRDPMGELGGLNLYHTCKNNDVDKNDVLGEHLRDGDAINRTKATLIIISSFNFSYYKKNQRGICCIPNNMSVAAIPLALAAGCSTKDQVGRTPGREYWGDVDAIIDFSGRPYKVAGSSTVTVTQTEDNNLEFASSTQNNEHGYGDYVFWRDEHKNTIIQQTRFANLDLANLYHDAEECAEKNKSVLDTIIRLQRRIETARYYLGRSPYSVSYLKTKPLGGE